MSEPVSRPGLYVMVFVAMLNSCDANTNSKQAIDEVQKLPKQVSSNANPL